MCVKNKREVKMGKLIGVMYQMQQISDYLEIECSKRRIPLFFNDSMDKYLGPGKKREVPGELAKILKGGKYA